MGRPANCLRARSGSPRRPLYAPLTAARFQPKGGAPGWKPAARRHYLVCPRAHVLSARSLGAADAAMARRMLEAGRAALEADFPDERDRPAFRFGFHLPPFNSVDHLHMHAFALPFEPEWKERKYSVESWARFAFEPAGETANRLERAKRATPRL